MAEAQQILMPWASYSVTGAAAVMRVSRRRVVAALRRLGWLQGDQQARAAAVEPDQIGDLAASIRDARRGSRRNAKLRLR